MLNSLHHFQHANILWMYIIDQPGHYTVHRYDNSVVLKIVRAAQAGPSMAHRSNQDGSFICSQRDSKRRKVEDRLGIGGPELSLESETNKRSSVTPGVREDGESKVKCNPAHSGVSGKAKTDWGADQY